MSQSIRFKKKLLSSCIAALGLAVCGGDVIAQAVDKTEKENIEEVVVTGIRGAQKAAVDVKRNSAVIVDSIVAEDIGKLPDTTIADSLQRISGIQIDRTAGEGSSLNVRGMPQVLTTLNGEEFLSPWSITSVGANYSDIPSSMIAGVDVFKSQSASILAGGISGVIDLKTRRGFDLEEGWTASANIEGSEGSITKDMNHEANAFVGWNNDDVAFTFGGFTSVTNAANYRMDDGLQYGFVNSNTGSDPYDLNNDGVTMGNERYLVAEGYGVKAYVMEREREGLAASFQTKISDSLIFSGDVFYTNMDQYDRGVEAQFNGSNSGKRDVLRPGSIVKEEYTVPATDLTGERVLYSVQVANVHAPDFQTTARSENNHTEAINTNFELAFNNGGPLTGKIRYVHADAERENVSSIFQQGSPVWLWMDDDGDGINDNIVLPFDVTVDYRGKYPTFSYAEDLSSVSRLRLYQGFSSGQEQDAGLDVLRVDGKYEFDFASFNSIDFGVRYGVRDVEHNDFVYLAPTGHYPWDYADPDLRDVVFEDDRKWQKYPDWKNVKDSEAVKERIISYNDFGPFSGFDTGVATLDPHSLDDPLAFSSMLYPGTEVFYNPERSYKVKEGATSVYLQGNFDNETGIFGIPFSGNLGVQVVRTDRAATKNVVPQFATPDEYYGFEEWHRVYKSLGQEVTEAGFTDVLPSANINFFPSDEVVLRFAYAETMTRNDLRNVGEGLTLWTGDYTRFDADGNPIYDTDGDGNIIDITGPDGVPDGIGDRFDTIRGPGGGNDAGNPSIEPWRANNFNASAEWYFAPGGILGAGVFLIDIESATESFQEQRRYPDEDGVIRREVNVWTTRNAGASDLKGFEIGYKQAFDFLPGLLSGLGTEFNYTYSDSQGAEEDLEGEKLPLPSNSEHQYNAVLWYQKDALSARVAYNWRSKQFDSRLGLNTNEEPLNLGNWAEAAGYLDASINYDVLDNMTVYLQGTNLGETNRRIYSQFDDALKALYVQERRVALGIRVRL